MVPAISEMMEVGRPGSYFASTQEKKLSPDE
jgi:hypothetical protein